MRLFQVIFLAWILMACNTTGIDIVIKDEYVAFFNHTITQQDVIFRTKGTDEQYDLFLFGNQVMHPPALYLADGFSEKGEQIIPFLSHKLKDANSELTIRDISSILVQIHRKKLYDVSKDAQLMLLLEKKVAGMKSIWKGSVERRIEEIKLPAARK